MDIPPLGIVIILVHERDEPTSALSSVRLDEKQASGKASYVVRRAEFY
jgi:hypothetical protein